MDIIISPDGTPFIEREPLTIELSPFESSNRIEKIYIGPEGSAGEFTITSQVGTYPTTAIYSSSARFFKYGNNPYVINTIPNQLLEALNNQTVVADLDTIFSDLNSDTLFYRVAADSHIIAELDGSILSLSAKAEFYDFSEVQVSAIDEDSSSASTSFYVFFKVFVEIKQEAPHLPAQFDLDQNFPNPFNQTTLIRYYMPKSGLISLKIYDILGRKIRTLFNSVQTKGSHKVSWDGRDESGADVSSGIYFYLMVAEDFSKCHKMILLK